MTPQELDALRNAREQADKIGVAWLRERGVVISRLADLISIKKLPSDLVQLLIEMLDIEFPDDNAALESIVRALTTPEVKGQASKKLIQLFVNKNDPGFRWVVANALSVVANKDDYSAIVPLWRDRSYGKAREMLAEALRVTKHPSTFHDLVEGLQDEEVAGHAVMALRKLADRRAKAYIEPFLNHSEAWVRNEAKKAIKSFDE